MKQNPSDQPSSASDSPLHPQGDWAELERKLRQPVAKPDEALCDRIMVEVRKNDRLQVPTSIPESGGWRIPWRAAGALGAAAAVVALVWLQPWRDSSGTTTQGSAVVTVTGGEPHNPMAASNLAAIRKEKELLVQDTKKIAAFLQSNLRL
jgi:hypothetical protein